jgi:hypothetical protein
MALDRSTIGDSMLAESNGRGGGAASEELPALPAERSIHGLEAARGDVDGTRAESA